MRIELPVNFNPDIYTYSYYGYNHAIISADERIGNLAARFKIYDYADKKWDCTTKCIINKDNGEFEFISDNPYQCDLNGCIYRELLQKDYIHVLLEFQEYTVPWGAVNLFIADEQKDIMDDEKYFCRFGYYNWNGLYLMGNNTPQIISSSCNKMPIHLLLHRNKNLVEAYAGENEKKLKRVGKFHLPSFSGGTLKMGVQIKLNDNSYYNWFFSNFIQISCNIYNKDRVLDYYYGVQKDWQWNTVHYFLNYSKYDIGVVKKYGYINFVIDCIRQGRYIELMVDQYYLENRDEYHTGHHFHQNLIYGYDKKRKMFLLVGYTNHGKITKAEISFRDFRYMLSRKCVVKEVTVIEYQQDGYRYWFHEEDVFQMLYEYLEGINSSVHLAHIVPKTKRIYGIKVYDEFLTEEGKKVFLNDRRIAHLLYEHKCCMIKRLQFLNHKQVISQQIAAEYEKLYGEIRNKMLNIRNLVIRNQMAGDVSVQDLIFIQLNEVKNSEKQILEEFLNKSYKNGVCI